MGKDKTRILLYNIITVREKNGREELMDDFIENAEGFIAGHLQEEFTLEDISRACGYSPFHFARRFKEETNKTVMECVREKRIHEAAEMIKTGSGICAAAMEYGFETHAGFTRAFKAVYGCCPRDYAAHCGGYYWKGWDDMDNSKVIIRPVSLEDVNGLWENVYSAMTPKEITEVKIKPAIEREKNGTGVELAAEVGGTVVMTLPMSKPYWIPLGFLFDNNYIAGKGKDGLMKALLEEMKARCRQMGIRTLVSPQRAGSENIKAFTGLGFEEAWESEEWVYLAMNI